MSYFKRPHPLRRWRTILSILAPVVGLLWLGGMAIAGSNAPYSSGPVSSAHAFAEQKCEVCHTSDSTFRAHVGDKACMTCHDGPQHASTAHDMPDCATCHREHQGRVQLASTRDGFCVDCHDGGARVAKNRAEAGRFPQDHPEFSVAQPTFKDTGTIKFNHEVHAKPDLRGPQGPEQLPCVQCHQPEIARVAARRPVSTGLMKPIVYEQQCARCHPLFFDERVDAAAPHEEPQVVRAFVQQALKTHIAANPRDLTATDRPRRLPLNFAPEPEPVARTPEEWVSRRMARAERLLWGKSCAECHQVTPASQPAQLPAIAPANVPKQWLQRAAFDHAPHLMVKCESCHAAQKSRLTSDVLMPNAATCATCHAPAKGASSACVECHAYHDWTKAKPVHPAFDLNQFR